MVGNQTYEWQYTLAASHSSVEFGCLLPSTAAY